MNHADPLEMRVDGFKVCGISVRTITSDEFDKNTAKLRKLWKRFYTEELVEQIPFRVPDSPYYGVYSQYDSDSSSYYTVTAGVKVTDDPSHLLEFTTADIEPGCYLVFSDKGPIPQVVIQTWTRIWSYFEEHQELQRKYESDFEMYSGPEEVAIYIGVSKK